MKFFDAKQVNAVLNFPQLIHALNAGFKQDFGMPQRQVYSLSKQAENHDAFAVLPAWNEEVIGVKAFTYFPNNGHAQNSLPTLFSNIMLFRRENGVPLAIVNGTSVTYWRTAAVSALASRYLAREDSSTLLLLGTGNLALPLIHAHCSEHALTTIYLWGRNLDKLRQLKKQAQQFYPDIQFIEAIILADAVGKADIIVCATGSAEPLIFGKQVRAGCHVDLLGNHSPDRRECDTALIVNASVYVDDRANVLKEAGELLIPMAENLFVASFIYADLAELCQHGKSSRKSEKEITVFKSVGTALSDLICAQLVVSTHEANIENEKNEQYE
jgi:1-pyrroline-2-carboxylate reductase [NAD(P)H]